MTATQPAESTPAKCQGETLICLPTKEPSVKLFILAAMLLGFAVLCIADQAKFRRPEEFGLNNPTAGYVLNHWSPYVLAPAGALLAILAIMQLRRKVKADCCGIGYTSGKRISWDDIAAIDATSLKSKGIMRIDSIRGPRLTLDSYKIQDFRKLVEMVERKVPSEKYVLK